MQKLKMCQMIILKELLKNELEPERMQLLMLNDFMKLIDRDELLF
jgi:hypothetical protein